MHITQEKILKLAKNTDISTMSLREIGSNIGISHPQTVKFHLNMLKKKGYLKDSKLNIFQTIKDAMSLQPEFVNIPVIGSANCGEATIFAEEHIEGYIKVSTTIASKSKGLYALIAQGDSMDRASINGSTIDGGDYVIVDSLDKNVKNDDYVVSVIDGCANIKKFKSDKVTGQILLMSESKNVYDPIYIHETDNFLITGKVKAVIKNSR